MTSALTPITLATASANPLVHLINGNYSWAFAFGGLLLCISLFAWSVIVSKTMGLRRSDKTDGVFLQRFRESAHPLQIFGTHAKSHGSMLHTVYSHGARELTYHWLGSSEADDTFEPRLRRAAPMSNRETTLFRTRLKRIAGEAGLALERRMHCLSCLVNSVPLLGLLATAWGLMAAFGASSTAGLSASAATAQPSIGTILSLSVLALLVAVPAGIGTRCLRNHLRRKAREIRLFCDEFDASISTAYHNATTDGPDAEHEVVTDRSDLAPEMEIEMEMAAAPEPSAQPDPAPVAKEAAPSMAPSTPATAVASAAAETALLEFTPSDGAAEIDATAISGQQLTFDAEPENHEFDDEPEINPVARQTAVHAPGLLFEAQT